MRAIVATVVLVVALACAARLGLSVRGWNRELELAPPPLAAIAPTVANPRTPALARRVVLVIIDGLGVEHSHLPYLDELRARGTGVTARVPYPTISRPNYVTILTGVPPAHSGVRTNRISRAVALDTLMDRVQSAGLRVVTASNLGSLTSLFRRGGTEGPFDDARRCKSLPELQATLAGFVAREPTGLVAILAGDVDKAGHAAGVGERYHAAARAVDDALRAALADVDLARDTILVTADHGHVARGGHGGTEPAASNVGVVLAGAGIVPGAQSRDARLQDIAPTIAALLGIPAPGHALGRPLVELLTLSPADAARRTGSAATRLAGLPTRVDDPAVSLPRLALVLLACVAACLLVVMLQRRGLVLVAPSSAFGVLAFVAILVAMSVVTGGQFSPSFVPSFARVTKIIALVGTAAVGAQVVLGVLAMRRQSRDEQLARAIGTALIGMGVALLAVGLVRCWFYPPHLVVPSPFWFVAVPALELAAAMACAAAAVGVIVALASAARSPRTPASSPR